MGWGTRNWHSRPLGHRKSLLGSYIRTRSRFYNFGQRPCVSVLTIFWWRWAGGKACGIALVLFLQRISRRIEPWWFHFSQILFSLIGSFWRNLSSCQLPWHPPWQSFPAIRFQVTNKILFQIGFWENSFLLFFPWKNFWSAIISKNCWFPGKMRSSFLVIRVKRG